MNVDLHLDGSQTIHHRTVVADLSHMRVSPRSNGKAIVPFRSFPFRFVPTIN